MSKRQQKPTIEERRRAVGVAMRERVRELKRLGKLRSVAALARSLGVHETTIHGYFRGENFGESSAFLTFCRSIGVDAQAADAGKIALTDPPPTATPPPSLDDRIDALIAEIRGEPEERDALAMLEFLASKRRQRLRDDR